MKKAAHKTELEKKLEAEMAGTRADSEIADKVTSAAAKLAEAETAGTRPDAEVIGINEAPVEDEQVVLAQEIAQLTAERDAAKDHLLRLRAEFDNYRKRTLREADRLRKTATEALVRDLLPVLDNLERALNHTQDVSGGLAEGVALVLNQFRETLAARGLEPIPANGRPFDPNVHEALSELPSEEHAAGIIVQEYERGYRVGDYVLRPAKVIVSSGPPQPAAPPAETGSATPFVSDNQTPATE